MELRTFIDEILLQLDQLARDNERKRNYLIEDLVFELHISEVNQINGGVNFVLGNLGGDTTLNNSNKVTIRLSPKNKRPKSIREERY
jgi:hypothetical protein